MTALAAHRHLLRRHPIPMRCHFDHSLVVAWALPAAVLEPLVPPGLELDTYDEVPGPDHPGGRFGFVVIAAVQTRALRPIGTPALLGADFALTGYRIFVRHRDANGRLRRGLHILRSDTDRPSMVIGGNLLTHYRYRLADVRIEADDRRLEVEITSPAGDADLHVVAHLADEPADLPLTSPFRTPQEARRFAGPLPWTFDHEPETESIVMVRGRRSAWRPQPTRVDIVRCSFLEHGHFRGATARLANAFHVHDIDYRWDRGVRLPIPAVARGPEPLATEASIDVAAHAVVVEPARHAGADAADVAEEAADRTQHVAIGSDLR